MKNFRKLLIKLIFGIVIGYSIIGFIILPYFIQFYIPTIIKKTIHTHSYVDSVHLNPFTFKVKISNFIIQDKNKQNLLFFETLNIDIDPLKLLERNIHFSNVMIDNLKLSINIDKNKVTNFQYILDSLQNKETNSSTKKETTEKTNDILLKIDTLALTNIRFLFEDNSKKSPFKIDTKPISLFSNDIQIKPNHTNKISLTVETHDTGKVSLQSNIVVEPFSVDGSLQLENIAVNKIFHYIKTPTMNFDIDSKPLNLWLDYKYSKLEHKQNILLENIKVELNQLHFVQNPFSVKIEKFYNTTQKVQLEIGDTIQYDVTNINNKIQNILFWDATKNSSLNFSDFLNIIEHISQDKTKPINITQSLHTPQSGTIQAKIQAISKPFNVNIALDTKDIAIAPYLSYIQDFANIDIKSAFVSNKGKVTVTQNNKKTNIDLKTDISLQKIDIFNSTNNQQLLKVDSLKLSDMHYKNNNLFIKNIIVEKPFIQFSMNDNNTTNFSNLTISTPSTKKDLETKPNSEEFVYLIDKISIKNGDSLFIDNTVSPKFVSKDSKITGDIQNLSSHKNKPTIITHRSIIDNYAPLFINTNMILSNPFKAMKSSIKVENIDLPSLSSYSGKFIGQTIKNGKLSLTLDYDIEKSQIKSTNNIKIKDIQLGDKVKSKDAINAPIGLAIALLEDSDGYIDLDIPIVGDINNPNFHFSDVVLDVITNTIVGIVSAPFKFLAMIIGIEGSDISNVAFNYGNSTLLVTQKEKLDNIIKSFEKRPNLKLKIKTAYVKQEDSLALKEIKFQKQYKQILTLNDNNDNFEDIYKQTKAIFIKKFSDTNYKKLKGENKEKYQQMVTKLKNSIKISTEELITLANKRAFVIQSYLLNKKLPQSRIIINKEIKNSTKDLKLDKALVLFEIESN